MIPGRAMDDEARKASTPTGAGADHPRGELPPAPSRLLEGWWVAFRNAFITIVVLSTALVTYLFYLSRDLPSIRQLQDFSPAVATKIISRDGKVIAELFTQKRVLIPFTQMPLDVRQALIAVEDSRFYDHWGVSMRDFARAVVVNLASLSYAEGFSSITQQLARNLYDTIGFKKTITRKLKEMLTAIQIERTYTKNEVMEMYLNSIYFGHGTYGIQAAAKEFFSVEARDLNLEQSAMLISVLPSPARFSPKVHPDRAFRRRNLVLAAMVDRGYLEEYEYEGLRYKPIDVKRLESSAGFAPYFTEHVRRQMELEDERLGINLYRDGLEIHTTLDSRMQAIAMKVFMEEILNNQRVLNDALLQNDSLIYSVIDTLLFPLDSVKAMIEGDIPIDDRLKDRLLVQGAFVLLENDTGHILAMIGGRADYPDYWNRSTQAQRQPGSVFKPILYMTAIDQGYPVSTQLLNQSLSSTDDAQLDTSFYDPRNDDGSSSGLVTMRLALRHSINIVSARMIQELVTPRQVVAMAKRFQLTTPMRAVRAISLGTSEVVPLEITAAYASIANGGVWVQPIAVSEIVDRRGKVLREFIPERKEIIRADKAYLLLDLMRGVVDRGTGARTRWMYQFNRPAAGKTGTTDNWSDAWFVGFTPQLAAGVWIGIDDPQVSLGEDRFGNVVALPIWARVMREIHQTFDLPVRNWQLPEDIVQLDICLVTKDRPTKFCPREKEIFIRGTEPPDRCQVHTGFDNKSYDPDDDIFLN
ncbi:MAG: PBP1A family penicillin-binding protein [Candidatus Marinimicrobia bacterium]|nr:PBP1A family penicillin-binding protein [Candidatus Neomarinimicrobiota bacterium]